jgi:SAM-dependent methyltransferase
MLQVLGDIPTPEKLFKEVYRVLKAAGCFIIFESMCYPEHDLPHDYYRVMPAGIEYLAEKSGFECREMVRLGGLFTRFSQLWNVCIMGRLMNFPIAGWLAYLGIAIANVFAYILDKIAPHPHMAADYIAKFVKKSNL